MSPNFDHIVILADESANWKIAGLRQLERLVLALDELAMSISSQRKIDIFIFWRPDIAAEQRWRPENPRLTRCNFVDALVVGGRERVFNTRLLVKRHGLEQFVHDSVPLENDATIGDEAAVWEKLWQRSENAGANADRPTSETWRYIASDSEITRGERWLLRGGGKSPDGLVSRFLNRPISRAVSRVLLKTSITPTGWTWLITVLPVIAFFFLIRGDYFGFVIGAALFQLYSILDGCDGEMARATYLESKRGEFLDSFCDFVGSILFVVGLGIGLERPREGILCAILIAANELFLGINPGKISLTSPELYTRHRRMVEHSGLHYLEKVVWWLANLTKRDVALLFFLVLALISLPDWILHLWTLVAGMSVILSSVATLRAGSREKLGAPPRFYRRTKYDARGQRDGEPLH